MEETALELALLQQHFSERKRIRHHSYMLHLMQLIYARQLLRHLSYNTFSQGQLCSRVAVKISVKITPFAFKSSDNERYAGVLLC